jgi:hypothetical protein
MVTAPPIVVPVAGVSIHTVGAVALTGVVTVTLASPTSPVPSLSVADTVITCGPALNPAVFNANV